MMRSLLLGSSLVVVLGLAGCFGSKKEEAPTAEQKPVAATTVSAIRVVNVLDKANFDDAHIKGSIHVPDTEVEAVSATWGKNIPVVFYCSNSMCMASGVSARKLKEKGFEKVYAYEGGMAEWYQKAQKDPSFAFEGPAAMEYLKLVTPKVAESVPAAGENVTITAEDLQKLMKAANLL